MKLISKKWMVVLALSGLINSALALPSVESTGRNEDEARARARIELSMLLRTEVKSEVYNYANKTGKSDAWTRNHSTSNLTLLGVTQSCHRIAAGEFSCTATLDAAQAQPLYRAALDDVQKKLKQGAVQLNRLAPAEQAPRLRELLALLDKAEGLALVYRLFDQTEQAAWPVEQGDLQNRLARLEKDIPDLQLAASQLLKQLPKDARYFMVAPKFSGSEEVTPFAQALKDAVASQLTSTTDLHEATHLLTGSYQLAGEHVFLTWRVARALTPDMQVITQTLNVAAANGLRIEPQQIGLDQLLQNGMLVKGDLRVTVATQSGALDGQSFKEGSKIKLMVKLNKPGYVALVSHVTDTACRQYAYLLQLNDALPGNLASKQPFMRVISAEEVNRYVEIGEFTVTPPFGVERMQVLASNQDLSADLPDFRWGGPDNGLAVVLQQKGIKQPDGSCKWQAGMPAKKITEHTRALVRNRPMLEKSESSFTFTTLPRTLSE